MTQHLHGVYVDGCYRCELSRDESERDAILEEIEVLVARLAARNSSLVFAKLGHGYVLEKRP